MKKSFCTLVFLFAVSLYSYAQKAYILKNTGGDCSGAEINVPINYSEQNKDKVLEITVTDIKDFRMTVFDGSGGKAFELDMSMLYDPQQHISDAGVHQRKMPLGWIEQKKPRKGNYFYVVAGTCLDGGSYSSKGPIMIVD